MLYFVKFLNNGGSPRFGEKNARSFEHRKKNYSQLEAFIFQIFIEWVNPSNLFYFANILETINGCIFFRLTVLLLSLN